MAIAEGDCPSCFLRSAPCEIAVSLPAVLKATAFKRMYENMGGIRYSIMVILLLFMALMPIKMVLRWLFNMKYFIYLPEFNANL